MNNDPEKYLKTISGGMMLDAACGAGGSIAFLKDALKDYIEITGVDSAPAERVFPKSNGIYDQENINYIQMDIHHLEFEDESFDTVSLINSIHHMTDPARVMKELARVLKPGGHAIIQEMYCDGQDEDEMSHVLLHHWWARIDSALGIPHFKTLLRMDLEAMIGLMNVEPVRYFDLKDDSDPFDPDKLKSLSGMIDMYFERASDLANLPDLKKEGNEIRERMKKVGFRWSKGLLAVCG